MSTVVIACSLLVPHLIGRACTILCNSYSLGSIMMTIVITCSVKAKMKVHKASVHGRVSCLLLHLVFGLGISGQKMKGVPHGCIGHHCLYHTDKLQPVLDMCTLGDHSRWIYLSRCGILDLRALTRLPCFKARLVLVAAA